MVSFIPIKLLNKQTNKQRKKGPQWLLYGEPPTRMEAGGEAGSKDPSEATVKATQVQR